MVAESDVPSMTGANHPPPLSEQPGPTAMTSRLAFRPDLDECALEERALLALPGLGFPQFIPSSGSSPAFVVSGFSTPGGSPGSGGSNPPGPQFYYLFVGVASGSTMGGAGTGGGTSIYNGGNTNPAPTLTVGPASNGAQSGGGGSGYGASISSGYNTALNSANSYGMTTTPVGSITAHTYGNTLPDATTTAADDTADSNRMNMDQANNAANAPTSSGAVKGVNPSPDINLLKKKQ